MAILSFTGQAKEIDINDFWLDDTSTRSAPYSSWWASSASSLQFFNEAQNLTLSQDIKISDPQDWDNLDNLGTINAGTVVDSHFIYAKNVQGAGRQSFTATFTFDSPIIGFMADDELFGDSDNKQTLNGNDELVGYRARVLKAGNTLEGPNSGLPEDIIRILGDDNNILEVIFTSQSAVDPLRVITLASGTVANPNPDSPVPTTPDEGNDDNNDNTGYNIIIDVDPNAASPGADEKDTLNGTAQPDLFMLGNESLAFYNNSNWNDRAEIIGFDDSQDKIQLHGSAGDYDLVQKNGDTRIFYYGEGSKEMIGIISGYSDAVSLTDDIFTYGTPTDSEPDSPEPVNQAPAAADDTDSTDENTAININVLGNDTDPDNDGLNLSVVDPTNTKGEVSINNDGTISYDPNGQFDDLEAGETATDSFGYTINDGQGNTDTATVSVTINGVSSTVQPPDEGNDDNNDNTGYNIIIDVDPNAASPGADEKDTLNGTAQPDLFMLGNESLAFYNNSNWNDRAEIIGFDDSQDKIQLHGSAGDYDLVQKNGDTRIFYYGEGSKEMIGIISGYSDAVSLTDDIFTYGTPTDSEPDSPEPVNQAPAAADDTDSTDENTAININVLGNDTDPDNDGLNLSVVDPTNTKGEVSINNDGTISYDPNGQFDDLEAGETATDSFGYTINDGQGNTDTATVSVTINGVSPTPSPETDSPNPDPIRIEAETATTLTNYTIQQPLGNFASGDQFIRLLDAAGEAEFVLDNIEPGSYQVKVGYFDESDGQGELSVKMGDTVLETWTLNQDLSASQPNATSFVERIVSTNLQITTGDVFSINGKANLGELAAVDYLEFTPVSQTETEDGQSQNYASANQGVFASLEEGVGFVPDKPLDKPLKIMPLGDSITQGVDGKQGSADVTPEEEQGGYRTLLGNKLQNLGIDVDFVGSKSNGPAELGDINHEGHPGWRTLDLFMGANRDGYTQETSGVNVWLPEYEPDAILLMIGTNSASDRKDNTSNMFSQIDRLLKRINNLTDNDPTYNNGEGSELVLATIPPANPERQGEIRPQNIQAYNQLIRDDIVGNSTYNIDGFVDIESILTLDDLADPETTGDNGLHPSQDGYDKMAKAWFEGLLDSQGSRDDLGQVDNLVGSDFDDVLTGNAASNRIEGGNGEDELAGKAGADTFVYQQPAEGTDTITDFDPAEGDRFEISASGFGGGLTLGTLASDQFVLATEATDANDRFLYDTASGNLFFDVDGSGAATSTLLATLSGNPMLNADDFSIVA